ncbi:hypothetical protein E1264_16245 [Actinomadura sp. KC216]|uniref:hypothetical protein n=1 Tax=Actinomadura sp. KC216 TaxID=2530370 RepID=UPI001052DF0B|nr:hypothetical protein [Actinomadura sp. KC216]TDB86953.1 hypothetical protein E1264_16245 [Actinomadura sp. KC216]
MDPRRNYTTYDPVLEQRPIPLIRVFNPLRAPAPGTALVLVPHEGHATTIRHGEPVPDARYGVHQYSVLVDLAEHRLAFEMPLVSRDPGFVFRGRVVVGCRVGEPAVVVERGIRDVGATLYDPIRHMLRPVARRFDISAFHEAEETLNQRLASFPGDSALRLRGSTVELLLDDDEIVKAARDYRDVRRRNRLEGMRRDEHLEWMNRHGVEGLLAEIMERDGPRAVLDWINRAEADERRELLDTLSKLFSRTGVDREPFDHIEAEREVVNRIIGGPNVAFGGTRPRRARDVPPQDLPPASVPYNDDDAPPPQYGYASDGADPFPESPVGDPPGSAPHDTAGSRTSRVRGIRRSHVPGSDAGSRNGRGENR